jgi:hypothetical protein
MFIGERNKLMEIMGITSMEQAENYDPALSWDNDEDEDDLYDIDEIIESNSKASEGDKGAITFNVNYNGFSYSLDVPVYLAEKSADGKKMRFDLDMVNIQKDIEPYDDDSFISKLKLGLQRWFDIDTDGITWRRGEGRYLDLTENEVDDIVKFLRFTHIPKEKQEKIKTILNIY